MAIMPGAIWRPLPRTLVPMRAYEILCEHTMVGSLWGTDGFFRSPGIGASSHFGTGGDGTIIQWIDTAYRAGANLDGNDEVISVENADMGPEFAPWNTNDGSAVPAFTSAQIEANAKIAAWVFEQHGIRLDPTPDSLPIRRGCGYHRHGVDPYRVSGGVKWSNSYGKACPGPRRIAQIPQIIDRARQIVGGAPLGGFLMALSDAQQEDLYLIAQQIRDVLGARGGLNTKTENSVTWLVRQMAPQIPKILAAQGVPAEQIVEALRPMLLEAVREGMAADNDAQAEAIVDRLAERLAGAA